ncbi:MAG: hypothetical protein JW910_01135 [Anaerolineae bacterium]|nr:hypothetical protein [Anaerolineae bacterium]
MSDYLAAYCLVEKRNTVLRWEILEIVEQDGTVVNAALYRPLGAAMDSEGYQIPFNPDNNAYQLISAVLFDGFEPMNQAVAVLPGGTVQKHWTFRLQVIT